MKLQELYAMLLYFIVVIGVGIYFYFLARRRGGSEKEYFLGNREMNGWVSALSAGASDMSAWVLMGLPGSIYLLGIGQVWISIGLLIGTIAAWVFVAPVLRRYSIVANDAITIPQFLNNRFLTKNKSLQIISAVIFMVTYCIYAASSIFACGLLFNTVLGMDTKIAMVIATVVIVVYTFLGGFNAVCWTDFFQGLLMLGALMLAPILACLMMNGSGFVKTAVPLPPNYYNAFSSGACNWKSISDILSGLGWGLGYFGMPHILIRYFAVKSEKEMRKSQIIGCSWIFIILAMATVVGLAGRSFFSALLPNKELVFVEMVRNVFEWIGNQTQLIGVATFVAGIFLSAILAASMSTADSQLLASASAFASDIYRPLFRKKASDKEMMRAGQLLVVLIAGIAFLIASRPECRGIMGLVSCAWAAFGSAFGPAILLALYWKRFNYAGAVAAISVGFIVDALWYVFCSESGLYEIIPGFFASLIAAVTVSLCTKAPSAEVLALFDASRKPTER